MFYGDSLITPAISVLSAVEGLEVQAPVLQRAVIPITVVILVALFMVQKKGTGVVGKIFGPVMLLWFLVLAAAGSGRCCSSRRCWRRSIRGGPSAS
jgi:KUP system potassium uptake protein